MIIFARKIPLPVCEVISEETRFLGVSKFFFTFVEGTFPFFPFFGVFTEGFVGFDFFRCFFLDGCSRNATPTLLFLDDMIEIFRIKSGDVKIT